MRYQSTTGLNRDQIEDLVAHIYHGQKAEEQCGPRWGRKPALGLYRSVVLTLVHLRSNLSQATLADLYGVSQSTVSRIVRRYSPLIGKVLGGCVPPLSEVTRGRLVVVDGTLVPTGTRAGQTGLYAGKSDNTARTSRFCPTWEEPSWLSPRPFPDPCTTAEQSQHRAGSHHSPRRRLSATSPTKEHSSSRPAGNHPDDSSREEARSPTAATPGFEPPWNAPSLTSRTGKSSPPDTAAASPSFPTSSAPSPRWSSTAAVGKRCE